MERATTNSARSHKSSPSKWPETRLDWPRACLNSLLSVIFRRYETSHPGDWNSTVLSDIATESFHEMYNNWEYDAEKKDGLYWIGDIISVMIGGQTDFYAIENQKRNTLYRKFTAGSRKLTQLLSVIDMSQYPHGYPGPQFKTRVTMRSCINGYVTACNKQHCVATPEDFPSPHPNPEPNPDPDRRTSPTSSTRTA